jgi:hypothetical protein
VATWTTADFLTAVRARAGLPDADGALSSVEILQIATEVQDTLVSEALRTAGGTYGVSVAADVSITSGTALYALPSRAQNAGALAIWYVDAGGLALEMAEIPPEESWRYQSQPLDLGRAPYCYAIEGDSVRLLPTPATTSGSIRIKYFARPGRLVETSRCGPILSSSGDATLTMDTALQAPGALLTVAGASRFDIIAGTPPFSTLYEERICKTYSAPTLTLEATTTIVDGVIPDRIPSDNMPRAWACPAYETCIPQLPVECHSLLIAGTVRDVLEAKGSMPGVALAEKTVDRELTRLRRMLESRVRAGSSAVVNRRSPYRAGMR